jgi:hypothetical protein
MVPHQNVENRKGGNELIRLRIVRQVGHIDEAESYTGVLELL